MRGILFSAYGGDNLRVRKIEGLKHAANIFRVLGSVGSRKHYFKKTTTSSFPAV